MSATTETRLELDSRWSDAWDAMKKAIVKLQALNDLCYDESGEPLFRVPRDEANALIAKAKEIQQEASCFDVIKEPSQALPQLPLIAA